MAIVLNVSNITKLLVTPLTLASIHFIYNVIFSDYTTQRTLYDGDLTAETIAASKILFDAFSYKIVSAIDSSYLT